MGTYSVKFFISKIERKKISLLDFHEISLDQVKGKLPSEFTTEEIQLEIVKSYLREHPLEGKMIFQLPLMFMTSRYLTLPVAQRKKAEMMIPFQLDEDLPFPIGEAHYTSYLYKNNNTTRAQVFTAKEDLFDEYYQVLKNNNILPSVLTTEVSVIQNYVESQKITGNFCILDIGHTTTKAYMITNLKVIANHVSHLGGQNLTEVIGETYHISPEEAQIYKHTNAFFLTEAQYQTVNENQRKFAEIMKRTVSPLLQDLKRWLLGFRVKNSFPLDRVYITGGSSQIQNIENFLSQHLDVEVSFLNIDSSMASKSAAYPEEKNLHRFSMVNMMTITQRNKLSLPNFLIGHYQSLFADNLSLHSSVFVGFRSIIFGLCLASLLGVEAFFVNKSAAQIDKTYKKMLRKPDVISMTVRELKRLKKKPEKLSKKIDQKIALKKKEIKSLLGLSKINALTPLAKISRTLKSNKKVNMVSFSSSNGESSASFSSDFPSELSTIKKILERSQLKDLNVNYKSGSKKLAINFKVSSDE